MNPCKIQHNSQVNTLKDIQLAQKMGVDTSAAASSAAAGPLPNPLDAKYAQLNADLSLLSRADPMHARICAYIQNTMPGATVDGSVRVC